MIKDEMYSSNQQISLEEQCGCGKQAKYMLTDGNTSCNKYSRCPTYEELVASNAELKEDISMLLQRIKELLVYREGTVSYNEAVGHIKAIARKNGFELEIWLG